VNLKQLFIDREFQSKYILYSLAMLLFIVISVFMIVIVWNHFRFYGGFLLQPPSGSKVLAWAQEHNIKPDSIEFAYQYMLQAKPYSFYDILITPLLVIFAINSVIIGLASFYISFKIARPVHELKLALRRKVETGQFDKPLILRQNDPFRELTSLANLALFVAHNPATKPFREVDDDRNLKGDQ
jgi:hypothetical protein